MSEEEVLDIIKNRLSLDVVVCGSFGDVTVSVKLMLDGNEIAYSQDFASVGASE